MSSSIILISLLGLLIPKTDTNDPGDDLCPNVAAIFCCETESDSNTGREGFFEMSQCKSAFQKLNANKRKAVDMRERRIKAKFEDAQQMKKEPSQAVIDYGFTSDKLTCPRVARGRAMIRIKKVCCILPWTRHPSPRECKECEYSSQ